MDTRAGFSDSNDHSGGNSSSICYVGNTESLSPEPPFPPDIAAIRRLSENLESIFDSSPPPEFDFFDDASIAVAGAEKSPFTGAFCRRGVRF
ncbi:hypothetical protein ACSBR1_039610 [Camellia fascicularis]